MTTALVERVVRLLLAPILVVAVAILVKGYVDVGDGFSAGVVAGLGVLLGYLALGREEAERALPIRRLPSAGLAGLLGALAIALLPLLGGKPILTHLPEPGVTPAKVGTLELITAVAFDAAIFVLVLGVVVGVLHTIARAGADEEDEGEGPAAGPERAEEPS